VIDVGLRPMTANEQKWWKELKVLLRQMPKNVELHARYDGALGIAPLGSEKRAFNESRHGDADSIAEYEWDSIAGLRLDGRDSQI
jgi:hypothetical protein